MSPSKHTVSGCESEFADFARRRSSRKARWYDGQAGVGDRRMTYKIITAAAMAILTVSTVSLRGTRPVYATDNSEENAVLAKASARTAQDQPNDRADCL